MVDTSSDVAGFISDKTATAIQQTWVNGKWVNLSDTNQRNNIQKSINNLSGLDKTVAALPHNYYSPDQPTGTSYNDTDRWYKTSTGSDGTIKYTPYKWDSTTSSWKPMLDQSAIHTFIGSAPASPVEGDFWTDHNTLKQYQKGSWVTIPTEGPQGLPGTSTYIHVAYATSSDGKTGFSTTSFDGAVYIGVLTDSNENDSTTYTDYTWSRMKGLDGTDGINGIQGPAGTDGKTTYVHFAYANSSDGNTGFNVVYFDNAEYIGTYTDFTEADSKTYTDYIWSRLKGDAGADGISPINLVIDSSNGYQFKNNIINTAFTAKLYQDNKEIDKDGTQYAYVWSKVNSDGTVDTAWNLAHQTSQKSITITNRDVLRRATFDCTAESLN